MLVKKVQRFWRAKRRGAANPFKGAMFKVSRSGLYGPSETVLMPSEVDCAKCKNETAMY